MRLVKLIEEHASTRPSLTALRTEDGRTTSYRDLARQVERARSGIQEAGLARRRIALAMVDPVAEFIMMLAGISSGCDVIPLPARTSSREQRAIALDAQANAVLERQLAGRGRPSNSSRAVAGRLLHFTSGSSGASKLVVRPLDNIVDETIAVASALGQSASGCVTITSPISHSYGCGLLRATIAAGGEAILFDTTRPIYERIDNIKKALRADATVIGVPFMFQALVRDPALRLPTGLNGYAGGAPLSESLVRRWQEIGGAVLAPEYGLGEGGVVTFGSAGDWFPIVGQPVANVRLTLRGPRPDGVGEVVVWRPHAPTRYLRGESPDSFTADGIRTGDLGRLLPDGRLAIIGRIKSVINVAGLRVVPQEVEQCIMELDGVEDVAVVGVVDSLTGERVVAYVQAEESVVAPGTCRRHVRGRLSSHKVPRTVFIVEDLPRLPSGKVNRQALEARS